jgi:diacylglycerol kinase family enzyme
MPTLIPRLFSDRRPAAHHRQIVHFDDVRSATVESISKTRAGEPRALQIQVDGDYIGERQQIQLRVEPEALTIVA